MIPFWKLETYPYNIVIEYEKTVTPLALKVYYIGVWVSGCLGADGGYFEPKVHDFRYG